MRCCEPPLTRVQIPLSIITLGIRAGALVVMLRFGDCLGLGFAPPIAFARTLAIAPAAARKL